MKRVSYLGSWVLLSLGVMFFALLFFAVASFLSALADPNLTALQRAGRIIGYLLFTGGAWGLRWFMGELYYEDKGAAPPSEKGSS